MGNGCFSRNPSAQKGRGSCVCRSPVAGRNRCSPPPGRCLAEMRCPRPVCAVRAGQGPLDHFITRPSARQRRAALFDTVQHQGRGSFARRKRRGTRRRRPSFDEPHSDLFVAWRAAEGCGGGERHSSSKSRLGRHRSRLLLLEPNAKAGSELLFIRPDGTSHVLWSQQGAPVTAIPSPDGTHLAIAGWTRQSNVWMLTDF